MQFGCGRNTDAEICACRDCNNEQLSCDCRRNTNIVTTKQQTLLARTTHVSPVVVSRRLSLCFDCFIPSFYPSLPSSYFELVQYSPASIVTAPIDPRSQHLCITGRCTAGSVSLLKLFATYWILDLQHKSIDVDRLLVPSLVLFLLSARAATIPLLYNVIQTPYCRMGIFRLVLNGSRNSLARSFFRLARARPLAQSHFQ